MGRLARIVRNGAAAVAAGAGIMLGAGADLASTGAHIGLQRVLLWALIAAGLIVAVVAALVLDRAQRAQNTLQQQFATVSTSLATQNDRLAVMETDLAAANKALRRQGGQARLEYARERLVKAARASLFHALDELGAPYRIQWRFGIEDVDKREWLVPPIEDGVAAGSWTPPAPGLPAPLFNDERGLCLERSRHIAEDDVPGIRIHITIEAPAGTKVADGSKAATLLLEGTWSNALRREVGEMSTLRREIAAVAAVMSGR